MAVKVKTQTGTVKCFTTGEEHGSPASISCEAWDWPAKTIIYLKNLRLVFSHSANHSNIWNLLVNVSKAAKHFNSLGTSNHKNKLKTEPYIITQNSLFKHHLLSAFHAYSSGAVWESRWPSWAVCPNEPSGFCGCKAILNHASALVSACP